MSDDLISRKALIENLNKFAPEHYTALVNELIMKQPAAFDKEKVIEELKEEGCIIDDDAGNRTVEIIEKGGIE